MQRVFTIFYDDISREIGANGAFIACKVASMDDGEGCSMPLDYLAGVLRLEEQAVKRLIKKLQAAGYIEYIPRFGCGLWPVFKKGVKIIPFSTKKGSQNNTLLDDKKGCQNNTLSLKNNNNINNNSNVTLTCELPHTRTRDKKPVKRVIFHKPTLQDVMEYCESRNNGVNAQRFIDYYESNGWMVGRNHMKDWRAAVRTWEQKDKQQNKHNYGRNYETDAREVFAAVGRDLGL